MSLPGRHGWFITRGLQQASRLLLPGLAAVLVSGCSGSAHAAQAMRDVEWCKHLVPKLPEVSQSDCERSNLKPTGAVSHNGFPILMREVPSQTGKEPLRVLLLGGIHGDELTAAAIVFRWMQWLDGPQARQIYWHVAPVVNPDGLLAPKSQRVNANGVDLNRNFPTPDWSEDAKRYWMSTTGSNPRRFPGSQPLSEPESRWLHDEIDRFRPDVIISVHAPFGVLDLDGPGKAPHRFGRLYYNRVGVYPGSLGNYGGMHKNIPVITIELPNALQMPPSKEVRRIWVDMVNWINRSVTNKNRRERQAVSSNRDANDH